MNTLARVLLASLMACPVLGFAQQIPLFQFTLHFEDTIGNQDSVIIGYDQSSSSQNLNPQFGEILVTAPFDSIFEVRVIHGDDSENRTLKKAIEHMEVPFDSCILPFRTKIVISAKFLPIKITYDSTLFLFGTCKNVVLSPDQNMFFLPEWWNVCEYHCMAGTSIYVEDFVIPSPPGFCGNRLYIQKEVEGLGLNLLPGLFLATFFGPGPCNDTTFLSANAVYSDVFGSLSPNPVRDYFSIRVPFEDGVQASVRNITGNLVECSFNISGETAQFDASMLSPGIYFVSLQSDHSKRVLYKFVKV